MDNYFEFFIKETKHSLNFLTSLGYSFSFKIYNPDSKEAKWLRVSFSNDLRKRELILDLSRKENFYLNILVTKLDIVPRSFSLASYIEFDKTKLPVEFAEPFSINPNFFETEVKDYLKETFQILCCKLEDVVKGKEWIEIPIIDLRDKYM